MPDRLETTGIGVAGMTRSAFLVRGVLATAAASGLAAVQPFVAAALGADQLEITGGPGAKSDIQAADLLLTLELLEADYYKRALAELSLSADTRDLAELIAKDEQQHVEKLRTAIELLGAKPGTPPRFKFALTNEAAFLELAEKLEEIGVGAYNGASPSIRSMPLLEAAVGIAQVEGRHAGAIRMARGKSPSEAFSQALDRGEVLDAAGGYIDKSK